MNGKQKTLFQAWGSSVGARVPPDRVARQKARAPRNRKRAGGPNSGGSRRPVGSLSVGWGVGGGCSSSGAGDPEEEEDDDDEVLLVAVYEAEKRLNSGSVVEEPREKSFSSLPGFDLAAGDLWIYPTNYPVRDYQFRIAEAALLNNTLVCLPTGLGKTFIAAVLMYNFYRWYPSGKIVFMAPTRPLVAQQIEACYKVMGIQQEHMAEMTGSTQALNRKEIWNNRRVFFLTPQVMVNDLSRGACPAAEIKCLVIDEAHKALGNHAYCQVVRELSNYTKQFRILALSATPGSDTKAVQQVVSNLLIARIELRSEDSPDIQSFSHERLLKKFVVPLGDELVAFQNAYLKVLEAFAVRLIQYNVLSRRDIPNLTKYQIILERDQFRKNPPTHIKGAQQGMVEGDFALCITLYHGYELLLQMGTRSLFIYLLAIMDGTKGVTRAKNELSRNAEFMDLYRQLEIMFTNASAAVAGHEHIKSFIYSHPKLKKLEEVVVEHFKSWKGCKGENISDGNQVDTRVMIFSSFRDSVHEIAEMLNRHQPFVRVMTFVGQSTGKNMKGFTQKEQLEVVKRFREGGYNTLVSTCVGEEGLDIGEVDLIICFDAQKSPIRLVQRMGRTGRKRQGSIVVILTEGREERIYNQSQSNKRSVYKAILGNNKIHLHPQSPRMVPDGLSPKVHKMYITQKIFEPKDSSRRNPKDRSSSTMCLKSSLFHNGTANSDLKEHWALTSEEFEVWDRLYRIQDSDGIKNVKLPQVRFESIRDMEEIKESCNENIHELSLTEWRIWQNRPFPTHMVDHSDRCNNFISIMEKIELMRHEEGACTYDSELMTYLHKDDIIRTKALHTKCIPSMTENKPAQKLPLSTKDLTDNSKKTKFSSSFINPDKEFISLFKESSSKGTNRLSAYNMRTPCLIEQYSSSQRNEGVCDVSAFPLMDCIVRSDTTNLPHETVNEEVFIEQCHGESSVLCDISIKGDVFGEHCGTFTNHTEALSNKLRHQPFGRIDADSGYSSFTDEIPSVSPSMFYPSETEHSCCVFAAKFIDNNNSKVKTVLTNVKRFLSQSPPPLDMLCDLEKTQAEAKDKVLYSSPLGRKSFLTRTEKKQDTEFTCHAVSTLFMTSEESVTLNAPTKLSLSTSSSSQISDDLKADVKVTVDAIWDKMFDCDNEEDVEPEHEMTAPMDYAQKSTTSDKSWAGPDEYEECGEDHAKYSVEDQNDSMDLFEDELFFEADQGSSSCTNEHVTVPSLHDNVPAIKPTVSSKIFDSCSYNECSKGELGELMGPEITGHFSEILEKSVDNDINYSQELFSVNFDLGFCIQDSDDDLTEDRDGINQNNNMKAGDMQNSVANNRSARDEHISDTNLSSPAVPHWRNGSLIVENMCSPVTSLSENARHEIMSEKHISLFSPLHLPAKKVSESPNGGVSTALISTPIGKKLINGRFSKRTPPDFLCKLQRDKSLTPTSKRKVGSQAVKSILLNKAFANSMDFSSNTKPNKEENFQSQCNAPVKVESSNESEDELVFQRRKKKAKGNVLKSPEVTESDCDSPVQAVKKRKHPLNTSDLSGDENSIFNKSSTISWKNVRDHHKLKASKRLGNNRHLILKSAGRQFLDEEAELSSEEAEGVSSDESGDSSNEENASILEFLDDNTQLSQDLNDSEMYGIYQKSVHRVATGNQFKMVYNGNGMNIFSQIPEQDETYMEDSFCVQEEEEDDDCQSREESSEEEILVNFDLLNQDSFIDGKKQYCTRRQLKLKQTKSTRYDEVPAKRKEGSRIIVLHDSSEEETDVLAKTDVAMNSCQTIAGRTCEKEARFQHPVSINSKSPVVNRKEPIHMLLDRCQARHNLKHSVSEMLDFQPENRAKVSNANIKKYTTIQATSKMERCAKNLSADSSSCFSNLNEQTFVRTGSKICLKEKLPVCILVDSREISSGPEVISLLKTVHSVKVEVCSLGACDYIVSNRLAVERKSLLELANSTNRNKLIEQIQHLQSMFERICVVLEKDRVKAGDTSRIFHRTKYYDSMLSSMVSAGIRILFSSSQEDTAGLLKELALAEHRKNAGILVPTEVTGHKREVLRFYLSIPHVSYVTALNLCHHFDSVKQMANSSVSDISTRAQVSHKKAEEIYSYMHYVFESQILAGSVNSKEKQDR
ncbi:Fanconi anemia group M protein [Microcaecilia unicolor]|uniref:ATP-dependent RNA helicase FANCM n=1 Tax=Microcaecilia unicolor TaxID=1415580 RepID=A0A6P7YR09_9AMPH|nr:Fanconi anemia group M protein [Microcaecilia unicolor]